MLIICQDSRNNLPNILLEIGMRVTFGNKIPDIILIVISNLPRNVEIVNLN